MTKDVAVHIADNGHVALAPEAVSRRATVKARKGDSVASLAKRYGLSAASVAEWNQASASSVLKMGQQVVLFLPVSARAPTASRIKSTAARRTSETRSSKAAAPANKLR